jgi:hypothetical protein
LSDTPSENAPLIRWKRWLPIASLLVVLVLLYAWDKQLKKTSVQGYVVAQADWTIGADNVPAAWQALYDTQVWETLRAEGDPLRESIVEQNKRLGIRISPQRWKTWLGTGATLSGVGEEWVLVARPGVLVRILDLVNGSSQSYGRYHYRWNDGFICISRSEGLLEKIGSENITLEFVPKEGNSPTITIQHSAPETLTCFVHINHVVFINGETKVQTSSIKFDTLEPFASILVLRDYVPEWATSHDSHTFQGNLEVKEVNPTEEPLPAKE